MENTLVMSKKKPSAGGDMGDNISNGNHDSCVNSVPTTEHNELKSSHVANGGGDLTDDDVCKNSPFSFTGDVTFEHV